MASSLDREAYRAIHYPYLDAYLAPARERSELWRLLVGILLIVIIWQGFVVACFALAQTLLMYANDWVDPGILAFAADGTFKPPLLMLALFSFSGLILGVWVVVRFLHKRSLSTVLGLSRGRFWRRWSRGAMFLLVINALAVPLALTTLPHENNVDLRTWIVWLAPALLFLFLQTGAEEIAFRGYLLQQLGARFGSALGWMVVPSILFGSMHFNTADYGANALLVVFMTTVMGAIAADITARTGSLATAMGLHFANNAIALLVLSLPGQLSGLTFWTLEISKDDTSQVTSLLISTMVTILAAYTGYRIWERRQRLGREVVETSL